MIRRAIVAVAFIVIAAAGCGAAESEDTGSATWTIADMLRQRPSGVVEVRGNVIVHPDRSARLCEGLAGSYPPQCGGKSVAVAGLDPRSLEHPDSASNVTWGKATLRGRLEGDVFKLS
jgi:hypothetical protein